MACRTALWLVLLLAVVHSGADNAGTESATSPAQEDKPVPDVSAEVVAAAVARAAYFMPPPPACHSDVWPLPDDGVTLAAHVHFTGVFHPPSNCSSCMADLCPLGCVQCGSAPTIIGILPDCVNLVASLMDNDPVAVEGVAVLSAGAIMLGRCFTEAPHHLANLLGGEPPVSAVTSTILAALSRASAAYFMPPACNTLVTPKRAHGTILLATVRFTGVFHPPSNCSGCTADLCPLGCVRCGSDQTIIRIFPECANLVASLMDNDLVFVEAIAAFSVGVIMLGRCYDITPYPPAN